MARRASYGNLPSARMRYLPQRPGFRESDEYDLDSPEMKRRRFNSIGGYHAVLPPEQAVRTLSTGPPAGSMRPYPVTPMPESGHLTRSKSGPMLPPPRPSVLGPWPERGRQAGRHASYDESNRLPPLQTSVPMSPSVGAELNMHQIATPVTELGISGTHDPQARSVEAMVMSISFTRKLSVLARISQPITSGPGSPGYRKRGAIIAVEGPKQRMLQQVGKVIEKALLTSQDVSLRTWGNSMGNEQAEGDRRPSASSSASLEQGESFVSCFQTITRWHQNSQEIVKHVSSQDGMAVRAVLKTEPEASRSRRGSIASPDAGEEQQKPRIPVALMKEGFSLTLSDSFACAVPIADSYAPIDHWQWMATLWRGIVGPDLVVYVKPSVEEEMAKLGSVDFQKRHGLMVVRIPIGGEIDEATERRVAFEVVEWTREESFREESGKF